MGAVRILAWPFVEEEPGTKRSSPAGLAKAMFDARFAKGKFEMAPIYKVRTKAALQKLLKSPEGEVFLIIDDARKLQNDYLGVVHEWKGTCSVLFFLPIEFEAL